MAEERVVSASDIKVLYDEYIPRKVEENTKQIKENIQTIENNTQQIQNNVQTIETNAQQIEQNVQNIQSQVAKISEIDSEVDTLTSRVDKLEKLGIKKKSVSGTTTEYGNLVLELTKENSLILIAVDDGTEFSTSIVCTPYLTKEGKWCIDCNSVRDAGKVTSQNVQLLIYYIDTTEQQIQIGL